MTNILSQETRTYKDNLQSLLETARGRFVLIHKHEILDVFEGEHAAIQAGYQKLGNVPFLVKEILEEDRVAIIG